MTVRYRFGAFELNPGARELHRAQAPLSLPRRVFDCIVYLIERRERAVGRDELVAALWSRVDIADTQLSQLIRRVRRAIDDDGQVQHAIRTVPGFGYRWAMPVEIVPDEILPPGTLSDEAGPADTPSDAIGVGSAVAAKRRMGSRFGRRALIGAAAVLLLVALAGLSLRFGSGARPDAAALASASPNVDPDVDPSSMAVLPLKVDAPREAGWVRLGAMDVVAERLRGAGLHLPSSENVLAAMQVAGAGGAERPDQIRNALGAALLVRGSAIKSPGGWHVELTTESSGGLSRRVTADRDDPLDAARAAADQMLAALGHANAPTGTESGGVEDDVARARAAMLAGELDTARSILESAVGNGQAPLIRYWLAHVDFMAGQLDQAATTFTALLAQALQSNDTIMQGRALIGRAGVHIRRSEYAGAEADFDAAASALRESGDASQFGEALAGRGIARAALHRFPEAVADLGAARAQLERVGDRFDIARVDANLGLVEMVRDRPAQALPYLESALTRFESFGAVSQILSTLNAVFDAQAWLLQWPAAFATSERRSELGLRSTDPMQRFLIGVDRSRVLTELGRYREAEAALAGVQQAYPHMRDPVAGALHAQRAELAWREQRPAEALAAARLALASWPDRRDDDNRARVALTYQRALIATGQANRDAGAPALAVTRDTASAHVSSPLYSIAVAEWADHLGHGREAEQAFRAGLDTAETQGLPKHIALASEAYGAWLLREGRRDDAGAVIGRVAPWAERDFDCALLQVALLHAWGDRTAWKSALDHAQVLAGERDIPVELKAVP